MDIINLAYSQLTMDHRMTQRRLIMHIVPFSKLNITIIEFLRIKSNSLKNWILTPARTFWVEVHTSKSCQGWELYSMVFILFLYFLYFLILYFCTKGQDMETLIFCLYFWINNRVVCGNRYLETIVLDFSIFIYHKI